MGNAPVRPRGPALCCLVSTCSFLIITATSRSYKEGDLVAAHTVEEPSCGSKKNIYRSTKDKPKWVKLNTLDKGGEVRANVTCQKTPSHEKRIIK